MILNAKTINWAVVLLWAAYASAQTAAAPSRRAQSQSAQPKAAQPKTAERNASAKQARRPNGVVETANFRIYGIGGSSGAVRIASDLESLRSRLVSDWLGEKPLATWSPKCEVRIHATVSSYAQAVGQDQFATVGVSRIDLSGRRVSLRRIDVRADQAGWFAAALPHELTHVIMADEFLGSELPNWADEGMAVLADAPLKQSLHLRDFQAGRTSGTDFRLADLVCQPCYPATRRIPVFYGQSLSLVKFLVERKSPAEFVRFLHRVEQVGCDAAITEIYGFRGVGELERQWLAACAAPADDILASANVPADARSSLVALIASRRLFPARGGCYDETFPKRFVEREFPCPTIPTSTGTNTASRVKSASA
jgi:hypothetical protein